MPSCNTPSRAEMTHCQPPCLDGQDCSAPGDVMVMAALLVVGAGLGIGLLLSSRAYRQPRQHTK